MNTPYFCTQCDKNDHFWFRRRTSMDTHCLPVTILPGTWYFSHQPVTSCHVFATEMAAPKKSQTEQFFLYYLYELWSQPYPDAYNYIPIIYYDIPLGNRCIIVFSMEVYSTQVIRRTTIPLQTTLWKNRFLLGREVYNILVRSFQIICY
jgi:hypothetical protein